MFVDLTNEAEKEKKYEREEKANKNQTDIDFPFALGFICADYRANKH